MNVVSLFSGAGGLDYGFRLAGFDIAAAVEADSTIWDTYSVNHPQTVLVKSDIRNVAADVFAGFDVAGVIGGPPCQAWSVAGKGRGVTDPRGLLFYEYIRMLEALRPRFFVAENVPGILSETHRPVLMHIMGEFNRLGYDVQTFVLNAKDFGAAQDRKRVIFAGFLGSVRSLDFSSLVKPRVSLKQAIGDLAETPVAAGAGNLANPAAVNSHEFYLAQYSSRYMSRNRHRSWDDVGFTVQASAKQAQLHPDSPPMMQLERDLYCFQPGLEHLYRRITVREAARLQGFPDSFTFHYDKVANGYKMVGNAVPVQLAAAVAETVKRTVKGY